ncbi:hypothetical protein [Larsenimonas rhizosphaerae]|uniref:Uncharacterized protein n=1 Tax=Larsenimonas rhizosphaerae TaxID=2944682 RepID=A0AA41ZFQ1_9GAMM|nr:hypothetical protein [Larsenimonas rhizosphaerae]MCM2129750.1 hypothetical protein [Larsenimonas rhizosphaerae]MCX2524409.1 hypothetical protein [Larsenimonas rhizosphaerae]
MNEPTSPPRQKRGCLMLMLGAVIFVAIVYTILIYLIRANQTPEQQANERQTVTRCFDRLETADNDAQRASIRTSCEEMAEQYQDKYKEAP